MLVWVEPWRLLEQISLPCRATLPVSALFRKSQISLSGGLVSQSGDNANTSLSYGGSKMSIDGNKTNASFDQIGFVWAMPNGRNSYLNFGFNFHKRRNFNQILSGANNLSNASLIKLTSIKNDLA
jgi:hypothetical protein